MNDRSPARTVRPHRGRSQRQGSGAVARNTQLPGFTVVEIMVVLGLVLGVISTLLVGLNFAARRARVANTEFLMNSIVAGFTRFRAETGYIPPLLGDPQQQQLGGAGTAFGQVGWGRDVLGSPSMPVIVTNGVISPNYSAWTPQDRQNLQSWCSVTTVPDYLLGLGNRSQDGYGVIMEANGSLPMNTNTPGYREQPALGIRNPGNDGAWGSVLNPRRDSPGNGLFASRNLAAADATTGNADSSGVFLRGKSLGPYIEAKSDSELGALTGFQPDGTPVVAKVGEINNFDLAPKCILDYFGKPLIFYRRGFRNGDPRDTDPSWSLADIVALRPQRFQPGEDTDAAPDANNDTSASRASRASEYALLSFGPDTRWDPTVRADAAGYNEDNIVRFGP